MLQLYVARRSVRRHRRTVDLESSDGPDYSQRSESVFVSAYTVIEDGTNNLWYEINYNHRQAWVPSSEVTVM